MFKNTISQDMQDAIKKIMDASSPVAEALVGNQHKIDKNKNGRIDAHDFKLLKGQKAAPVKEEQTDEAHTPSHQAAPNYIPPPAHGYNEEADQEVAEGWDDMMKDVKKKAADKGTGKFDRKELKPGVTQYTRKSKTFTDGGSDADLRKANRKSNEEVEADETIVIHNAFTVELKEAYSFGEYLTAAKNLVSDDDAVAFANAAFQAQDTSIFTEEYATAYIISKIQEHIQAGQVVSEPKYNTKDGEPYHEYTVTDKEGIHRSYIHHGTVK